MQLEFNTQDLEVISNAVFAKLLEANQELSAACAKQAGVEVAQCKVDVLKETLNKIDKALCQALDK